MPGLDSSGKVVGVLLREDHETGNYYKCYVAISFETHLLGMYPMEAEGKSDLSKFTPFSEIKCQYITKVGIASSRPRILNCFEIVTTGVVHHFCVDSIEERDEFNRLYKKWKAGEIDGPDVTAGLNKFRQEWAKPDNPESMIFTEEVLQQLGKKREDLPTNDEEAKRAYEKDLIAKGVPEEEAKKLTKEMFLGIDNFTTFYEDFKNDYNNQIRDDGAIRIK